MIRNYIMSEQLLILPPLPPSPLSTPETTPKLTAKIIKPEYNHSIWPSPIPKLLVKRIYYCINITVPKRITHQQALDILAKQFNCTIEEFLKKSKKEVYGRWFTIKSPYGRYVQDPFSSGYKSRLY